MGLATVNTVNIKIPTLNPIAEVDPGMGTKGPAGPVLYGLVASKWSPRLHFQADLAIFKQPGEHLYTRNINGKVNSNVITVTSSASLCPLVCEILDSPLY